MLKWVIRICFMIIGGTIGVFTLPELWITLGVNDIFVINNPYTDALVGALIFYLITFWAVKYVVAALNWLENGLTKTSNTVIIYGGLGLMIGLVIAFFCRECVESDENPDFKFSGTGNFNVGARLFGLPGWD